MRVLVVGGAANGWATAFHLLRLEPDLDVTVIEKDPTLARSSTMLSDGNVRIQFNLEENIAISVYAMECLETFPLTMAVGDFVPEPQMRKQGNLFLVDAAGREEALAGLSTQQRLGCDSRWLDIAEIIAIHPALASDDLVGGTFGPSDGSVDPTAVVEGYRRNALAKGASATIATVDSLSSTGGHVTGVVLTDGSSVGADVVVVCAGAWSTDLLRTVGVSIPVEPVMRTVYVVAGDVPGARDLPSIFLPSGVYVIPEHDGTFLIAWSTDDDPVGFDFTPAPRAKFYDVIWPELASTLPAFDRLEVVRSWAGLYAQNRLDANAIVGEWPTLSGLYQATGFSGHGFQQCHAVGRYLAERICDVPLSIDLGRLGPERTSPGSHSSSMPAGSSRSRRHGLGPPRRCLGFWDVERWCLDELLRAGRYAGCILLADISGYSGFLTRVQVAHADDAFANDQVPAAYSMMSGFLEGIASTLDPPMTVLKFEGDAAFAVCTHETAPQGSRLMGMIEGCYSDFRSRLAAADQVWTCTCDACSRKDSLDLKFIVHHGDYYIQAVGRQLEAVGPEVNVAHRLLKTHAAEAVATAGYALFTFEAVDALDLDLDDAAQVDEIVDDGRLVATRVVALSA